MAEEKKQSRIVTGKWDLSAYKWRIETDGFGLMLEGLKDKKLLGRKCHQCGTVYLPGQKFCRKCFIDIDEVVEVKDTGKIVTYTVSLADVRGNPIDDPRIGAVVKLEGCDSWFMGLIKNVDWKELKVGMPVKVVWKDKTEGKLADMDHYIPV